MEKPLLAMRLFFILILLKDGQKGNMENLIELGAIEVIPQFRGFGVGKVLLTVSMMDDAMEDYIIITTEYYWHWDLKGTGLNVWEYRKIMEKMMNAGVLNGMQQMILKFVLILPIV